MTTAVLHLVDSEGSPISKEVQEALNFSFRWAVWKYPLIDPALMATWAEQIGAAMSVRTIQSYKRYATAALHGKIREYYRSGGDREISVGLSRELEHFAGVEDRLTGTIEKSILFHQMNAQLSGRDKMILVLLRQDISSPRDVGIALGLSYDAAAKAIQRVRDRLREILIATADATLDKEVR